MKMKSKLALLVAAASTGLTFGWAAPAAAQATRTWVSGTGSDANPCSRTAPCQTFAGAISKTATGGEIDCLDPGGFGALTINKSITVDCKHTMGGVLNSSVNGIIINDSATATPNTAEVILRGISIDGVGTGLNGIRFIAGRSLVVEDVLVQNQNGASAHGISITPGASAEVYLEDVTVTDGAGGINIQPTGAAGALRATFRNVLSQNNSQNGLRIDTTGNTAPFGIIVAIENSRFSGNNLNGITVNAPAGTTTAAIQMDDSEVSHNTQTGIVTAGSGATIRVSKTMITGNATGVTVGAGSVINTFGNNQNRGNGANGAFTLPALTED